MAVVNSVTLGSKKVDIEAFTGDVVQARIVEQAHHDTDKYGRQWRRSTTYWSNFRVRNGEGKEQSVEVWQSIANVSDGQRVTLFWGIKNEKATNWLAVYNHATDALGFVPGPLNKLAGPGGNWHGVMLFGCGVFQFFALFGMLQMYFTAWIMFLVFCAPWLWVYQRRQTLKQAIRDAIPRSGQARPLTPDAPARRTPHDNEIHI